MTSQLAEDLLTTKQIIQKHGLCRQAFSNGHSVCTDGALRLTAAIAAGRPETALYTALYAAISPSSYPLEIWKRYQDACSTVIRYAGQATGVKDRTLWYYNDQVAGGDPAIVIGWIDKALADEGALALPDA